MVHTVYQCGSYLYRVVHTVSRLLSSNGWLQPNSAFVLKDESAPTCAPRAPLGARVLPQAQAGGAVSLDNKDSIEGGREKKDMSRKDMGPSPITEDGREKKGRTEGGHEKKKTVDRRPSRLRQASVGEQFRTQLAELVEAIGVRTPSSSGGATWPADTLGEP